MYSIDFDPSARLLRLKLSGFWEAETAQAFASDLVAAARAAAAVGPYRVLSDARAFAVQSADMVERFRHFAQQADAERTAILVDSHLAMLQARRSMASERIRIFSDEGEALAWLDQAR